MTNYDKSLEKIEILAELYDYYGVLLTQKERLVIEKFVEEGLSVAEIAEDMRCSRQGVYDTLLRIEKKLNSLERKLGILKRDKLLLDYLQSVSNTFPEKEREEIKNLILKIGGDYSGS